MDRLGHERRPLLRSWRAALLAAGAAVAFVAGCTLLVPIDDDLAGESTDVSSDDGGSGKTDASVEDDGAVRADGALAPDADAASTDAGSAYARAVLEDRPIVYLRLDEDGGTAASNLGTGADGLYASTGITFGARGALVADGNTAVTFTDGTGQIAVSGGAFAGKAPYTVELWVKPVAGSASGLGFVVDNQDHVAPRAGWGLRVSETAIAFERWADAGASGSITSGAPAAGVWQHLAGVYDGTRAYLYVDGVVVANTLSGLELPSRPAGFKVGHQNCTCPGTNSFRGDVDEFALYDKALPAERIQAHVAAAK